MAGIRVPTAGAAHGAPAGRRSTARERIDLLLDAGSFVEVGALVRHRSADFGLAGHRPAGDGVVTGRGTVDGRPLCVFSQDATVFGGSLGEAHGEKILTVLDLAMRIRCPVVGINDGAGARLQEGMVAGAVYGQIFRRNVLASGMVPQLSLIMGTCAGGACYSPTLTDFVIMVDGSSHMFLTGPDVVRAVSGEEVSLAELGGAWPHNTRSGAAHYLAADEDDALRYARELLSYLPSDCDSAPPVAAPPHPADPAAGAELDRLIPDARSRSYDMRDVLDRVLDRGELLEVQPLFAPNIVVGFGRVDGHSVGVVANQPLHRAGCLDIDAAEKAARFVRTCDAFNVPVLTFVDVPGFLPGTRQEWDGVLRRGAKLIYAYAEATVPKVTVIVRKAYGGGYLVMGSKHLGADVNLAWPTAEIGIMGGPGAIDVMHRRRLAAEADRPGGDVPALRARLQRDYEARQTHPYLMAERCHLDAVIQPAHTRRHVAAALRALRGKHEPRPAKKHGNIPL